MHSSPFLHTARGQLSTFVHAFARNDSAGRRGSVVVPISSMNSTAMQTDQQEPDMHHRAFFSFEPSLLLADLGNIVSIQLVAPTAAAELLSDLVSLQRFWSAM